MTMQTIVQLLTENNFPAAKQYCLKLLTTQPDFPEIPKLHNILGILASKDNNIPESISYFKQAIYYAPKEAIYYNNLSNALKKQGNLSEAKQYLYHSITLAPNHAETFNNLGSLFYTEGRYKEAIPYFQKAIRLQPNYWEPHYNLANSLVKDNLVTTAISHYQTTLTLKPDHIMAQQNLAMAYIAIGNSRAAIPYLEAILPYNTQHAELHAQLAEAYLECGKTTEAITMLTKALALSPKQATWQHNLAILYLREQQPEQALTHFQATLAINPHNPTATHMINALTTSKSNNAPLKYVTALFDQYAQYYNQHVTDRLAYKVPALLRQAVGQYYKTKLHPMRILDLGCGTGLCSIYFRELAQYLVGIDLSAAMLAQAQTLNSYDALCRGNILQAIPGVTTANFDLIVAADVLVYCGDLHKLFQLCHQALKPQGMFAFTVEQLAYGNYQLQTSGRFAHSLAYITNLAKKSNFTIKYEQIITLRLHHEQPITGLLFLIIKN